MDVVVLVALLLGGMVGPLVLVLHRIGVVVHWGLVWVNLLHFVVNHWFWCMVRHWFWCMVRHWLWCMVRHRFWCHWLRGMIDWFCVD